MASLTITEALKHILGESYHLESELRRGEVVNANDRLLRMREHIEKLLREYTNS